MVIHSITCHISTINSLINSNSIYFPNYQTVDISYITALSKYYLQKLIPETDSTRKIIKNGFRVHKSSKSQQSTLLTTAAPRARRLRRAPKSDGIFPLAVCEVLIAFSCLRVFVPKITFLYSKALI
jgi:hypothetical protein